MRDALAAMDAHLKKPAGTTKKPGDKGKVSGTG
jgi:hypothetical protein